MKNTWRIAVAALVLLGLTLVSLKVDAWWTAREAVTTERIAVRDRAIAARDLAIKARDAEIAALKRRDTAIVDTISHRTRQLAVAKTSLDSAKQALDADAATHAGLVPIAAVHMVEQKADSAIASCEHVNDAQASRIDELLLQLAKHEDNRADLDTNRAQGDSTRKDVVAVLKPPWFKRALGWIDDHAVTLLVGAAGGFALAKMP